MSRPSAYWRTLSATRLAAAIREREVSSVEIVGAHIERARQVHRAINAVVVDRFDDAMAEAALADEQVASGERLGPLHGVPCTIKECFAFDGMPQTSGLVARIGLLAKGNATTVARLRDAGAIPIGLTNISELCMWLESNNRVYGRTNNPYDTGRIVGGSSGGEGAIVGAGASPFGLAADVGGSIRMPAFFNGVFGHKPSSGRVPNTGQYPLPSGHIDGLRFLSTGPICRAAEDLPLLLDVLSGPDGMCRACVEMPSKDPHAVDFRGRPVFDIRSDGTTPVSTALQDAQARAARALEGAGAHVERRTLPALKHALEIWSAMMGEANTVPFADLLGEGTRIPVAREWVKWAFGRSPHTFPALGLAVVEQLAAKMEKRHDEMLTIGAELRAELAELLGEDGVMLYPSYAETAPRHVAPLLPPTRWAYTAILNVMQMPSTQVPMGLDARGLPTGVQVAAAHGNDHLCMAGAMLLERAAGGWVHPRAV